MKMAPYFAENLEKHKQKVDQTLSIPRCPGPWKPRMPLLPPLVTVTLLAVLCQTPGMPFGTGLKVWSSHFL